MTCKKEFREKALDAFVDHLDRFEEHPQIDFIIRFSFPDLHDFCDYEEALEELTNEELEEYCDDLDNPRLTESNYDSVWEECQYLASEKMFVSRFDIDDKYLIWVD